MSEKGERLMWGEETERRAGAWKSPRAFVCYTLPSPNNINPSGFAQKQQRSV